jgi:teichuronic acid biosynthesis glycosyltransferase TuaC
MNVLFVSSGNSKYGISPIILNQGKSLIETGLTVDFFGIKGKGPLGYIKNILPLRRILKSQNYQLIHSHYGFSGIVAVLARRKEKVVISFMGNDVILSGDYSLVVKLKYLAEILLNRFFSRFLFDFVIVKSQEMFDNLPGTKKKSIIPNGVNLDLFNPIPKAEARNILGLDHKKKIVLFGSDPNRLEKNFYLAEKSVSIVKVPDIQMIALTGIEQQYLNNYYSAADVLLLTSFQEGSPNVIKEAMACNCPIVSTDVGDVRKLVDGVDACFISTFDPSEVANKISKALAFEGRTNGRQKLIELGLDQKLVALKLISIYNELVK